MSITMTVGATTLTLDPDLSWSDEHKWNPVRQSTERSITGALIVQTGGLTKGRPITLENDEGSGWVLMTATVVNQLKTWASTPGLVAVLNLRGVDIDVMFRHGDENSTLAFESNPLVEYRDVAAEDHYLCIIRLMEI